MIDSLLDVLVIADLITSVFVGGAVRTLLLPFQEERELQSSASKEEAEGDCPS